MFLKVFLPSISEFQSTIYKITVYLLQQIVFINIKILKILLKFVTKNLPQNFYEKEI